MSLLFRMLWVWWCTRRLPALQLEPLETRWRWRTLPNDLDVNLHMNNGRYLTICDLSRVDLFIRSGLTKGMRLYGWQPLIIEVSMRFKRPLKLFQAFDSVLKLTHWDERAFYMVHEFWVGDRIVAEGHSVGVVRNREGVIAPAQVIAQLEKMRQGSRQDTSGSAKDGA